ncbi:MAG: hypothetical protein CL609_15520 [Anaerolineaceae bacterium]|nr:hypothetical protein [Anaerolineaceae bacterium]
MFLAHRNLIQNKTRLLLSVGGVSLAIMLILLLNGFLAGMNRQITSYIDNSTGSLIIAQKGVDNLLGATSLLSVNALEDVKKVNGVNDVVPILSQFVIFDLRGKKLPAYLIGYDPNQGGGPWKIREGREPMTDTEMVFDDVLAKRNDLQIGDKFEILGQDFTIVGLSENTTSWMTSFFFIRISAAKKLLRNPGAISFLLITPEKNIETGNLLKNLNRISGINAITKNEIADNDIRLFAKVFSAPIKLMVFISFLVGTMIVGLIIYTATVERQREYGVLKAIGAANQILYKVVITQAFVTSLIGALLSILLAFSVGNWIMAIRPQFLILFDPLDVLWAILAGVGMALFAAFIPTRVLAKLAPAEVFQK